MEIKSKLEKRGDSEMTGKRIFLAAFTFCLAGISVASEDTNRDRILLVTAKPTNAKFVRDTARPGTIASPLIYNVDLEDVRVVQGDRSYYRKRMTVELRATHIEEMLTYPSIYLLIDTATLKPKVLYWERVISLACLPDQLVDSRYEDFYFNDPWHEPNTKCTFLRGYEAPPEAE